MWIAVSVILLSRLTEYACSVCGDCAFALHGSELGLHCTGCRKLHVLVLISIIVSSTLLVFSCPFVFEKQAQRSRGSIITVKNQKGEDGGFPPPTPMVA